MSAAPATSTNAPEARKSLRAAQAFFDRVLGSEECMGDFGNAEAAKCFEDQGDLGFGGKLGMTTGKHHAKLIVANLLVKRGRFAG